MNIIDVSGSFGVSGGNESVLILFMSFCNFLALQWMELYYNNFYSFSDHLIQVI